MTKTNVTKEKIVKVAQSLMAKDGYSGVSMADIAQGVGITKASLYYFFKNKEAIYLAVLGRIVDEVTQHYTIKPEEKGSKQLLIEKTEKSIKYGIRHGVIIATPEMTDFKKNASELVELDKKVKEMESIIQTLLKKCDVENPKFSAQILIDVTHAHVKRALCEANKRTPKKFATDIVNILKK